MTPARLRAINRYWRIHPPVAWLIAAQMKYQSPTETTKSNVMRMPTPNKKPKNLDTLTSMFGLRPGAKVSM